MVGFDENDDFTTASFVAGPPKGGSYASGLLSARSSDLRIGVVHELFGLDSDPEMAVVNSCVRAAISKLEETGAKVVDLSIPNLAEYATSTSLYQTRSKHDLNTFFATNTHSALKHLTISSIHEEKAFHPALDLFKFIAEGPDDPHDDPAYSKKLVAQQEFRRVVLSTMAAHEVDILAFPDCKIAAPKTEDMLNGRWGIYDFPTNTLLASQAILPAVSVPTGLTDGEIGKGGGLPVGMEMVGLPYAEQLLLNAAAVVEKLCRVREPPNL
jgi:amidase